MSKFHLQSLEETLGRRGWRIVAVCPGNDYDVSASWEILRSTNRPSQFIDFYGLEDLACLPLDESYGCRIRGRSAKDEAASLYFRKPIKSRDLWEKDLEAFVLALENVGTADPVALPDRPSK